MQKVYLGGLLGKTTTEGKGRKQNWSELNCNVDLMEVATNSAENSEAAELFQVDVRGPVRSPPTQISPFMWAVPQEG